MTQGTRRTRCPAPSRASVAGHHGRRQQRRAQHVTGDRCRRRSWCCTRPSPTGACRRRRSARSSTRERSCSVPVTSVATNVVPTRSSAADADPLAPTLAEPAVERCDDGCARRGRRGRAPRGRRGAAAGARCQPGQQHHRCGGPQQTRRPDRRPHLCHALIPPRSRPSVSALPCGSGSAVERLSLPRRTPGLAVLTVAHSHPGRIAPTGWLQQIRPAIRTRSLTPRSTHTAPNCRSPASPSPGTM